MKLYNPFKKNKTKDNLPTVVTFEGGMGAQIISAAIYFRLREQGNTAYADLSYFFLPDEEIQNREKNGLTHWNWQLDSFNLTPDSFEQSPHTHSTDVNFLCDGAEKGDTGLQALACPEIQKYFPLPHENINILPSEFLSGFLCIHIRRGDYLNVASHIISNEEFIDLSKKLSHLIDNAIILSDSPIGPELRNELTMHFKRTLFLDEVDAFTAHCIMRSARILVCSNSQFSLTAAILNQDALTLIPKQWFDEKERHFESPIQSRCKFQVIDTPCENI